MWLTVSININTEYYSKKIYTGCFRRNAKLHRCVNSKQKALYRHRSDSKQLRGYGLPKKNASFSEINNCIFSVKNCAQAYEVDDMKNVIYQVNKQAIIFEYRPSRFRTYIVFSRSNFLFLSNRTYVNIDFLYLELPKEHAHKVWQIPLQTPCI